MRHVLTSPTSKTKNMRYRTNNITYYFAKLRLPRVWSHSRTGSQFEELLVPKRSNQCFPISEPDKFPVLGTCGSQLMIPNLGATGFQELLVPKRPNQCFKCWNHRLPDLGTSSSQTLEPMPPNLGNTGS